MDEYLNKFHKLGGNTIAEHKKNFNVFTRTLQQDPNFDADAFFANLRPKHRQEEIFRVKLQQSFNRHAELLEVIKGGDRILCRIALKDENFLNGLLEKFSGRDFIDQLTPCISYVTRVNLVNKFSYLIKDEGVGEEYYTAVYEKYGLNAASTLLVACSEKLVKKILNEFSPNLTDRVLIHLHKKSPGLLEEYLKIHPNSYYAVKLSTYLAKYDLNEFHKLTEYGRFNLGKRIFARYFKIHKNQFIKDPDHFPLTWKKRAVCKLLTLGDIRKVLTKLLRDRRSWRFYAESFYLIHYPRRLRGAIMFPAFKIARGYEMWEKPDGVEENLLEILSLDDRMKFDFLDRFPELLPLETAIKTLKNKINVTAEIFDRADLVQKMLKACHLDSNTGAELLDVLKYFHKRHKNDNADVRSNFLRYLVQHFPLEKLGAEFWNLIEEMMLLVEVNNENLHCSGDLLAKFLVYKMSNGLEYEKVLLKFYKQQGLYSGNLSEKIGKFEKVCLLHFPELIPQIYSQKTEQKSAKVRFLSEILDYTRRHPNDPICPYDYFEFWMAQLEQYNENKFLNAKLTILLLEQNPKNDVQKEMYDSFWGKIEETGADGFAREMYMWLLKNRPWVLVKYADGLVVHAGGWSEPTLFYEASKVEYLGLTSLLTESATKILADPNSEARAINASIQYLSHQNSNVLSDIAMNFAPNSDFKINVREESAGKELKIRTEMLGSFKNTPLPSALINNLLPFCNADYFQYALEPLYYTMYHIKESEIEGPIFELLNRAVSVRKHTIHLAGALGSIQLKLRVFTQMANTEKNVSVKKYIFKQIHSLFINEKSETSWRLLHDSMHLVSKDDEETLNTLKFCQDVPKKFINAYFQMIWDYFAKFNNGSEFELIAHFDLNNPSTAPFFEQVARNSLFNPKNKSVNPTETFTAQYLLLGLEDMDRRLEIVWRLIKNYLSGSGECQVKVQTVYNLISRICELLQDANPGESHKALIRKIRGRFGELGVTTDILTFELLLKFTAFRTEWNKEFKTLAVFVVAEFNAIVNKFGPNIIHYYADFITKRVNMWFPYDHRNVNMLKLIKIILESDFSPELGLLCLLLLPSNCNNDDKKVLDEVLLVLGTNPSQWLRVYLDTFLQERVN